MKECRVQDGDATWVIVIAESRGPELEFAAAFVIRTWGRRGGRKFPDSDNPGAGAKIVDALTSEQLLHGNLQQSDALGDALQAKHHG